MTTADPAREPSADDGRGLPRRPRPEPRALPVDPATRRGIPSRRVDDLFERQRTASELLPDPKPLIVNLTRFTVEILAGVRELDQISRWIDPDAYERLHRSLRGITRSHRPGGKPPVWPRYQLGGTRIDRPADGVIECATVIHHRPPERSGSIALRLVGIDGRWRATRIDPIFL